MLPKFLIENLQNELYCIDTEACIQMFDNVHFHSSELYRVGSKKLIKKDAISSLFCKCDESVKLERRKKLKHVIHNNSCCGKNCLDIKVLEESANKTVCY